MSRDELWVVYEGDVEETYCTRTPASVGVYAVGWLKALHDVARRWRLQPLVREARYVCYQVRAHNWRAVRNTFNGYLCEHEHEGWGHNCGTGWTKHAATRRAERICASDWRRMGGAQ